MQFDESHIQALVHKATHAPLKVQTMGRFAAWRGEEEIPPKAWGRDKTIQLFQFLITTRHQKAKHKEQIIHRLWEDADFGAGDRDFKVALHGINKTLEPERKSRTEAHFILRQGLTYQLNHEDIWIDADAFEKFIQIGNHSLAHDPVLAKTAYEAALPLYQGEYLPERLFEDWSSAERERLQVLALGAMIMLAELILTENPMESIRLAQQALLIDHAWEDAYRVQITAYGQKGNRPMAIKTYQQCCNILEQEFGIEPLPETKASYRKIMAYKEG